jgi:RNase P subunit RPR2
MDRKFARNCIKCKPGKLRIEITNGIVYWLCDKCGFQVRIPSAEHNGQYIMAYEKF